MVSHVARMTMAKKGEYQDSLEASRKRLKSNNLSLSPWISYIGTLTVLSLFVSGFVESIPKSVEKRVELESVFHDIPLCHRRLLSCKERLTHFYYKQRVISTRKTIISNHTGQRKQIDTSQYNYYPLTTHSHQIALLHRGCRKIGLGQFVSGKAKQNLLESIGGKMPGRGNWSSGQRQTQSPGSAGRGTTQAPGRGRGERRKERLPIVPHATSTTPTRVDVLDEYGPRVLPLEQLEETLEAIGGAMDALLEHSHEVPAVSEETVGSTQDYSDTSGLGRELERAILSSLPPGDSVRSQGDAGSEQGRQNSSPQVTPTSRDPPASTRAVYSKASTTAPPRKRNKKVFPASS